MCNISNDIPLYLSSNSGTECGRHYGNLYAEKYGKAPTNKETITFVVKSMGYEYSFSQSYNICREARCAAYTFLANTRYSKVRDVVDSLTKECWAFTLEVIQEKVPDLSLSDIYHVVYEYEKNKTLRKYNVWEGDKQITYLMTKAGVVEAKRCSKYN